MKVLAACDVGTFIYALFADTAQPASVKDKYKILRILSSMTRTPFEVKIVE